MSADERLQRAIDDLKARVATEVAVDDGPHRAVAPSAPRLPARPGWRHPALVGLAAAVAGVVAASGLWLAAARPTDHDLATEPPPTGPEPWPTGPDPAHGEQISRFDTRTGTEVFVVTEHDGVTMAGFAASLHQLRPLPIEAVDAGPDGAGGIVYVTADEVWQLPAGSDTPRRLESPGAEVEIELVGLRHTGGDPVVLVRIGEKLIGYRPDVAPGANALVAGVGGQLVAVLSSGPAGGGFGGTVTDLAVEGSAVVAVVAYADATVAVEVASLPVDDPFLSGARRLTTPVPAGEDRAPQLVAATGDRYVVVDGFPIARVLGADGVEVGRIPLPAPAEGPLGRSSLDAAGDQVLYSFVESLVVVDLATGERSAGGTDDLPPGLVYRASLAAPPSPTATSSEPASAAGQRFRVDTKQVGADRTDPFLNVRLGPAAGEALLAKLPPAYRGLRATGNQAPAGDGGTWIEVELLHPVEVTPPEPLHGGSPVGWVNAAFVVPLVDGISVGTGEVAACRVGSEPEGGDGGTGAPGEAYVAGLESRLLSPTCLRVVVTFSPGRAPLLWEEVPAGTGTAPGLPPATELRGGVSGTVIDLGPGVDSAWPGAVDTADGIYLVRDEEFHLDLVATPGARASVSRLPGRLVVDLDLTGDDLPPRGNEVVLTGQPTIGDGSIELTGIARPFEANLGMVVRGADGEPVEAVFSGSSSLGTVRARSYAVQTTDWTEAWGRFAVRVEGLRAGDYRLELGSEGPHILTVPFTIERAGPTPALANSDDQAAALALIALARGASFEAVPLADTMTLGLGAGEQRRAERAALADRQAWSWEADGYAARSGPLNPLDVMAHGRVRITAGPVDHCASPPLDRPPNLDQLRRVNIEPVGIDSCLDWFGVSLFLDDAGRIAAVVLDLWEP